MTNKELRAILKRFDKNAEVVIKVDLDGQKFTFPIKEIGANVNQDNVWTLVLEALPYNPEPKK